MEFTVWGITPRFAKCVSVQRFLTEVKLDKKIKTMQRRIIFQTLFALALSNGAINLAAQTCVTEKVTVSLVSVGYIPPDGEVGVDPRVTASATLTGGTATPYACVMVNNLDYDPPFAYNVVLNSLTLACGGALPTVTVSYTAHEDDGFANSCTFDGGGLDDNNVSGGPLTIDITGIRSNNVINFTTTNGPWTFNFQAQWSKDIVGPDGAATTQLWMRASDLVQADNTAVSSWSGAGATPKIYQQTTPASQPVFRSSAANLINFNPVVDFDGTDDELIGSSIFGIGNHPNCNVYTVTKPSNLTSLNTAFGEYINGNTGFFLFGTPFNSNAAFYTGPTVSNSVSVAWGGTLGVPYLFTGNSSTTAAPTGGKMNIRRNGLQIASTSPAVIASVGSGVQSYLGAYHDLSAYFNNGDIAEVIVVNSTLTLAQNIEIESYLATKYGMTLGGNASTTASYTNSDGTVVYTANSGFHYNIAGIGRDDVRGLLQKQSQSSNTGTNENIITMGLSTVAATNAANAGAISVDKSFMYWGDDNGAVTQATAVSGTSLVRMARCWKIQESGTIGAVQVRIPKSLFSQSPQLITSADNVFDNTDTFKTPNSSDATYYYFDTVNFTDGQFFTFARMADPSPGGVVGAAIWLKADAGITTGATMTWADQSGNNRNAVQSTAARQPTVNSSLINYNPALVLDGTDDFMPIQNLVGLPTGAGAVEGFAVARNLNTAGGWNHIISYGGTGANSFFTLGKQTGTANAVTAFNASDAISSSLEYASGATALTNGKYTGTQGVISSFGTQRGTINFTGVKLTTAGNVGTDPTSVLTTCWNGNIAESIIFPGNLTTTQVNQVDSYLAIKYGITKAGNYIASDGTTTTWTSGGGFDNDIAGIGMDDLSGLAQKQSASVNAANIVSAKNILAIALGYFAATNAANGNTFAADKTFLVTGNNGATTAFGGTVTGAGGITHMNRIWLAKETATVGTTKFRVPISLFGSGTPYMYISNDGATFSNTDQQVAMTAVGDYYEASVDLTSRANTSFHFTFAELTALPVTLTLNMTASPATVTPTSALQYVVTLANTSANTAYNVKIKDQIPAGVNVGSVVPSIGTWDAATKIWTVPTLGPSPATATLTINTVVQ